MSDPMSLSRDNEIVLQEYLQAVRSGQFAQASEVIQQAVRQGLNPVRIYDKVFAPSLRAVGELWETGQMNVAQEHLATGITEYCRTLLLNLPATTAQPTIGKVLLTNVSGNQHTLGLNLLCDAFRWRGWQVFPLITSLPEEQIAQAANLYQVDLVCLSVALPGQIMRAISTIKALRQSQWKGLIEIGGPAFVNNESAFQATDADFLGLDAESTVSEATDRLAISSRP